MRAAVRRDNMKQGWMQIISGLRREEVFEVTVRCIRRLVSILQYSRRQYRECAVLCCAVRITVVR